MRLRDALNPVTATDAHLGVAFHGAVPHL
jgi:hypothetical protein